MAAENSTMTADVSSTAAPRRWWRVEGVVALLLACVVGVYAFWHHQRYKHFAVHEAGRVYRSAWMEADVIGEVVQANGIKTVINLCRPGEMGPTRAADERKAVEAAGAKLVELPLPDTADPHDERIRAHISLLKDAATYPVLIHCQHGVNRTARTLAMYEVLQHGIDGEAAIRQMPRFGRRDYAPLEYEFAKNFTAAYRSKQTADANPSSRH